MKRLRLALCAAITLLPIFSFAAAPIVVNQLRRAFSIRELHIQQGGTITFNNIDDFLHQLYVDSKKFKFSSKEQAPGESVNITFPTSGTFEVRCEIHPKMLLNVIVE